MDSIWVSETYDPGSIPGKATDKKQKLNKAFDLLNKKYDKDTFKYVIQGTKNEWKLTSDHLSKCYTTKFNEVPVINLNCA